METKLIEQSDQFNQLLQEVSRVFIIIPQVIDADALVSALVLADYLKERHLTVQLISRGKIDDYFKPISQEWSVSQDWPKETVSRLIILVDTPTLERSGFKKEIRENRSSKVVVFDHHPKSDLTKIADLMISDPSWSSTAEAIFWTVLSQTKLKSEKASLLLLAVLADTKGFSFNISESTFRLASQLLSAGADLDYAQRFLFQFFNPINKLKLWGEVSQKAKLIKELDLLIAVVPETLLKQFNLDSNSLLGLINYLASQNVAGLTLLISEDNGQIRGSIRSTKKSLEAGQLAKLFTGSGFDRAGGFSIPGKFVTKDSRVVIE